MAVLFDLDGTLIGTERDKNELRNESARKYGAPEIDSEEYFQTLKKVLESGMVDTRVPIFEEIFEDRGLAEKVAEDYRRKSLKFTYVFPDVLEALNDIDVSVGLVTNGARLIQREKIREFDLEGYFEAIVVSGELGIAKPDPRIFKVALDQLDSSPAQSLYVGNSREIDVGGANNAGMVSVLINRDGKEVKDCKPDYEIQDLRDLKGILEEKE